MKHRRNQNPFSLFSFQDVITGLCGIMIFFVMILVVDLVNSREDASCQEDAIRPLFLNEQILDELREKIRALKTILAKLETELKQVIVEVAEEVKPELDEQRQEELTESEREVAALLSQVAALETKVKREKETNAKNREILLEMEQTRRLLLKKINALKNKKGITLIPEWGEAKIPIYVICSGSGIEILRPLEKVKRLFYEHEKSQAPFIDNIIKLDHTVYTVVMLVRPSGIPYMKKYVDLCKNFGYTIGRDPLEEDVEVTLTKAGDEK